MRYLLLIALLLLSCNKDNKEFTLKAIKLNSYKMPANAAEHLFLKILDISHPGDPLAVTRSYPAQLTLPATFSVSPAVKWKLYRKGYHIELWGDSTGRIGACDVNMEEYKIIFPIDMEVKSDDLNVSIMGSWE
ncbi:hypothetical protein [Chitinophaga polysaccharea]|uniref:hypothetical protein n=1 Tax=Chitinophaga polysaccharea TaxID=1293035 RepID=UPI0011598393|nr:hypothetical protein [Chitinophaga polysaccharea]